MPNGEAPTVAPSPDFMAGSTASMWTPGPFENEAVRARYLITDVDPKWSEREKEEYLGSINYPQLWTTSIHEAYRDTSFRDCICGKFSRWCAAAGHWLPRALSKAGRTTLNR